MSGHKTTRRRNHGREAGREPRWHKAARQVCPTCTGAGRYHAAYPRRLIDPCGRCKGTGRIED